MGALLPLCKEKSFSNNGIVWDCQPRRLLSGLIDGKKGKGYDSKQLKLKIHGVAEGNTLSRTNDYD